MEPTKVNLSQAVTDKDGGQTSEVSIAEPMAAHLRGVDTVKLLSLDFAAMEVLLPRVSNLSTAGVNQLRAADFLAVATAALGFLVDAGNAPQE